jgi:hypothetical protein
MVSACNDASAAGRTQRGGVHIAVAKTMGSESINVRCLDRTAEATQLTKSGVIEDDEEHIG